MTLEEENVSPVVKDQDVKKLDFKVEEYDKYL